MPEPILDPAITGSRHRWALAARGALALVIGLWLLFAPLGGLVTLVAVVAMWLAVDGVVALLAGLWSGRGDAPRLISLTQALASLILATLVLVLPALSLLSLVWTVAAWAIWQGVAEVLLSRVLPFRAPLAVGGAVSIVAGILLIALPAILTPLEGGPSLVTAIALYGLVRGLYLLAAAGRARRPAVLP